MMLRRAKILATLGPACATEDQIRRLVQAGMDGARLNFSHGTHDQHAQVIERVRKIAQELDRPIAVVQDLQGPKLRTGELPDHKPVTLEAGSKLTLSTEPVIGSAQKLYVDYEHLPKDVQAGDQILLDDGRIELKVTAVKGTQVETEVVTGGPIGEHKGLNLPGVALSAPSLTKKDYDDLTFGIGQGVDMVAMSFIRRPEDVRSLRETADAERDSALRLPLVSKLERREAIDNLGAILDASDGVMVARGDLGVEMAAEKVPSIQKRIISRANARQRLVITATQMLESMIREPRPTRAEASDVANAVFDGSDVLMLSGETASGAYPIRSVETMARIIVDAEAHAIEWGFHPGDDEQPTDDDAVATTQAAKALAEERDARAIAVFTRSGRTALLMSKARPRTPILGLTPETRTFNRMALYWGVQPCLIPMADSVEDMVGRMEDALHQTTQVHDGDRVVLVASLPVGALGPANMTYLHTVGGPFVAESALRKT
jgi:pyruvate kinase